MHERYKVVMLKVLKRIQIYVFVNCFGGTRFKKAIFDNIGLVFGVFINFNNPFRMKPFNDHDKKKLHGGERRVL